MKMLSTKLYRWYIEELKEEILDIINSENSGSSPQQRLNKIEDIMNKIDDEDLREN